MFVPSTVPCHGYSKVHFIIAPQHSYTYSLQPSTHKHDYVYKLYFPNILLYYFPTILVYSVYLCDFLYLVLLHKQFSNR